MSRPFEELQQRLLKAGVAPRHVRLYVRELEEHLSDLIAEQNTRDYHGEDALLRARALLGSDDELAGALIRDRRFRSLTSKAPWLIFGVTPPFLIFAMLLTLVPVGVGFAYLFDLQHNTVPGWWVDAYRGFAEYAIGPLLAIAYLIWARQRYMPSLWPKISTIVVATLSALTIFVVRLPTPHVAKSGQISIGFGAEAFTWGPAGRFLLTAVVVWAVYLILSRRRSTL